MDIGRQVGKIAEQYEATLTWMKFRPKMILTLGIVGVMGLSAVSAYAIGSYNHSKNIAADTLRIEAAQILMSSPPYTNCVDKVFDLVNQQPQLFQDPWHSGPTMTLDKAVETLCLYR